MFASVIKVKIKTNWHSEGHVKLMEDEVRLNTCEYLTVMLL